jgi:hypothetical protein
VTRDQPPFGQAPETHSERYTPLEAYGYAGHVFMARDDEYHVFIYVPKDHPYVKAEGVEARKRLLGVDMLGVGLYERPGHRRYRTALRISNYADAVLAFVEIAHRFERMAQHMNAELP